MINPSRRRKKRRTTRKKTTRSKTTRRRSTRKKIGTTKKTRTLRTKGIGARTMAKRRRKSTRTTKRRRTYRRNPTTRRRVARRATSGLSFKKALKNVVALDIGMFSAKFAAKLWGADATEIDPNSWDAMSYIKAGAGAVGAGFLANMIKPGLGQKVMEGGLAFTMFKALENEVIAGNATASKWLGEDDAYVYDGIGAEDPNVLVLDDEETPYMQGANGEYLPLDESHRMLPEIQYDGVGDILAPPGRLGDILTPPGRLGFGDARSDMLTAYKRDYS